MQVYLIVALLFALIVAVFAVQNATAVDIRFLFWKIDQVPLSLLILISVAAGAIIVFVVGAFRQLRTSMQVRELTAKLQELKSKETTPPKTRPLADSGSAAKKDNK